MKESMIIVGALMSVVAIFAITLSFLNRNSRLSEFAFQFKFGNISVNTKTLYSGEDTKKAIEENPNDHLLTY